MRFRRGKEQKLGFLRGELKSGIVEWKGMIEIQGEKWETGVCARLGIWNQVGIELRWIREYEYVWFYFLCTYRRICMYICCARYRKGKCRDYREIGSGVFKTF